MNSFLFGVANNKTSAVVRIAVMLALTVLVQYLTGLAGIQLLTGSVVNLFLILAAILTGIVGGVVVGVVTPFIALLIGINSNIVLVPFIALANALLVVAFAVIFNTDKEKNNIVKLMLTLIFAVLIAAMLKLLFMYFICVDLILPLFLPAAAVTKLSAAWGLVQFFAALIGGGVASALFVSFKNTKLFKKQ